MIENFNPISNCAISAIWTFKRENDRVVKACFWNVPFIIILHRYPASKAARIQHTSGLYMCINMKFFLHKIKFHIHTAYARQNDLHKGQRDVITDIHVNN